ncbi:MAG: copper resistance protein B [Pseudomonadota bacterium]|nr:copper resistance protein B [Pseudomonadota bacterium]
MSRLGRQARHARHARQQRAGRVARCVLALLGPWVLAMAPALAGNAARASADGAPPDWPEPVMDDARYAFLLVDQLERRDGDTDRLGWDVLGWYGGDYRRLWLETEGSAQLGSEAGDLEHFDLLYGRLIAPFWDLQAGLGYEKAYGAGADPDRAYAVLGLQGLAPGWWEVDANLRVDEAGEASVDLELEYDLRLTQRLILQPRLETRYAFGASPQFGVGEHLNELVGGLRLRYEIRREFAPYLGWRWQQRYGQTADLARAAGEAVVTDAVVVGVRLWY